MVKFQQEDDDQEYSIYLNPGFTPLKVEDPACYGRGNLVLIDYTDWVIELVIYEIGGMMREGSTPLLVPKMVGLVIFNIYKVGKLSRPMPAL